MPPLPPFATPEPPVEDPSLGQSLVPQEPPDPYKNTARLMELFEKVKKEAMENRWAWEREWIRDLFYVSGRQWITFHPTRRQWVDKRLQKWIPRPVTNKMAETLSAIRTTFGAINLIPKVIPVGNDSRSVAAAEASDQMAPLIHEEHLMDQVMRESDFWLIATGTSCLQTSWDLDQRTNRIFIPFEKCTTCGTVSPPAVIEQAQNTCPTCGQSQFEPAIDPKGQPQGEFKAHGRGKTTALSPFEYAVPQSFTRFDELPYVIRLRWRDKYWFEANRPDLVPTISWEKSPKDRSLQIFKSLSTSNDLGGGANTNLGATTSEVGEGVTEYELWYKPTPEYPRGLVMRVIGENSSRLLEVPNENLPGPFPYTDVEGTPLFPFNFAQYEQIGGRLYGRSAISPIVQKQDQLNQLDSLIQLIVQRMANPIWIVPEDAGIEHFTGEPGLVMKWRALASNGNAKPERIAGAEVPASLWNLRQQILDDIEALSGAFDIIKGQKPAGVEAFSALQLLVERSQSRFTSVFQARGEMYRRWFSVALELERQFGPDLRVRAVMGTNRGFTFQRFQNAQLQGQVTIKIEDGSNMPKTTLGKRAAIEQATQMTLLNPEDPDQKYALLSNLGLSDLVPTLNTHVQAALKVQDAFESWAQNPQGPPPLSFKPWYDAQVHWVEHIKWLNTDRMTEIFASNPVFEQIITQYLAILQQTMMPPSLGVGPEGPSPIGGGGMALSNSNANSGSTDSLPSGNNEIGPNVGPA